MADTHQPDSTDLPFPFDVEDERINTVPANMVIPILTHNEITLMFAFQHEKPGVGVATLPNTRVVMSHGSFVKAMFFLNRYAEYLLAMYEGRPMSLEDVSPEKSQEGIHILLGRPEHGEAKTGA